MANYEGSAGTVKVDVDGTGTPVAVAAVRSWSLDITRDTVETTSMASGGHRSYVKGLQDFSGSMDIVYDDSEDTLASSALNPDTDGAVTIELYSDGNADTTKFVGPVIVTSYSISANYDGLTEVSVSFNGNGQLTTASI